MSQLRRFSGIIPANLLFTANLAIDELAYRRHLRRLADTLGPARRHPGRHRHRG